MGGTSTNIQLPATQETWKDSNSSCTGEVVVVGCDEPCPCVATAPNISICLNEVTIEDLEDMIGDKAKCESIPGTNECDVTPKIDISGVTVANGFVTGGSYTATCQSSDDCLAVVATGIVTAVPCCKCDAVAPEIKVCPNKVTIAQLEDKIEDEAACKNLPGAVCTATPLIDTSGVTVSGGYVTGGTYKVTCQSNTESCTDVATGTVSVVDSPECHPCDCTATAPNVCIEIVYSDSIGYHQYTYDEVLAAVKKQGGKCDGSCSEMSLKFFQWGKEIGYNSLKWNYPADYQYKVVCEDSDGTCTAQSGFGNLDVRQHCNC